MSHWLPWCYVSSCIWYLDVNANLLSSLAMITNCWHYRAFHFKSRRKRTQIVKSVHARMQLHFVGVDWCHWHTRVVSYPYREVKLYFSTFLFVMHWTKCCLRRNFTHTFCKSRVIEGKILEGKWWREMGSLARATCVMFVLCCVKLLKDLHSRHGWIFVFQNILIMWDFTRWQPRLSQNHGQMGPMLKSLNVSFNVWSCHRQMFTLTQSDESTLCSSTSQTRWE